MLLSVMFKLAHMFIVIFCMAYVFKKWILPIIRHSFLHDQKIKTQLQDQVTTLNEEHTALAHLIHQEELDIVRLKQTIEQWRIKEEERIEYMNIACNARRQFAQKQAAERIVMQRQKRQDAYIMNEALVRAEQTLLDYFDQNTQEAKKYNACIVDHMRKS